MSVTDIPAQSRGGVAVELDELQGFLDLMRRTAVSAGTWVSGSDVYHCGSVEEVDAVASQWSAALGQEVTARWNVEGTQYRAQAGGCDRNASAVFIPPVPVTLAEAVCGSAA